MKVIKVFFAVCRCLLLAAGLAWLGLTPALAAITHVNSTSAASVGATSALTLTLPAAINANDVLIAAVTHVSKGGTWPNPPVGWTRLSYDSGSNANNSKGESQQPDLRVWYRVATSADVAGQTVVFNLPPGKSLSRSAGGISAYRGVATNLPVVKSSMSANPTRAYVDASTITPGVVNTFLVGIWAAETSIASAPPPGMTKAYDGASPDGVSTAVSIYSAHEVWASSGATGNRRVTLGANADGRAVMLALKPQTTASLDHYQVTLPPNSAKCTAAPVTVTACGNSSSPCTAPFTGVSGTTANLTASAGTLGAGTVTFSTAGVASTTLSNSAGGLTTVTLSSTPTTASNPLKCCSGSSCSNAVNNSCSTTFGDPGLVLAANTNSPAQWADIPNQISGGTSGTFYVRPESCGSDVLPTLTNVKFGYTCINPATCAGANLMSIGGGSATTIARNDFGSQSGLTTVNLPSSGAFTLNYSDVGQVALMVRATMNGRTVNLSSNSFVVKPFGLVVSDIKQAAPPNLANPAATGANGAAFLKAGQSFTAKVTATNSAGRPTPNFGKETLPEGVLLSPMLVLPSPGSEGTLDNGSIPGGSFGQGVAGVPGEPGVATASNLAWSEVGILRLTPSLEDDDYLGAGAVAGTASANIGRFYPDHFDVVGTITPAMTTFTYMGQPFGLGLTVAAKNAKGDVVTNYEGDFAKLNLAAPGALGLQAFGKPDSSAPSLDLSSRLSVVGTPTGSWTGGQFDLTAMLTFSRPQGANNAAAANSWGPFEPLSVRVSPVDTDGDDVACAVTPCSAELDSIMRLGRLRLSNTISGGVQKPKVDMIAQYYAAGGRWLTNGLDNRTEFQPASVVGSANLGTLTSPLAAQTVTLMRNGLGSIIFAAPATPQSGSFDIAVNLSATGPDTSCNASHGGVPSGLVWLKDIANCASGTSTWAQDPSATVKLQSAAAAVAKQRFIFLRERY